MTDASSNRPKSAADATAAGEPEADRLEQLTPLSDDEEAFEPPAEPPFEADEGDALEQAMAVPMDDDYPPDA